MMGSCRLVEIELRKRQFEDVNKVSRIVGRSSKFIPLHSQHGQNMGSAFQSQAHLKILNVDQGKSAALHARVNILGEGSAG